MNNVESLVAAIAQICYLHQVQTYITLDAEALGTEEDFEASLEGKELYEIADFRWIPHMP